MPACQIHILSLSSSSTIPNFIQALQSHEKTFKPLVIARVVRWIILPTTISTGPLLARNIHWDLLLIFPSAQRIPAALEKLIEHQWTVNAGVPSRLLQDFDKKNEKLLKPSKEDIPPLTGSLDKPRVASSAQGLELSPELKEWISEFGKTEQGSSAVSMLNLLAFKPGLKEDYLKYGAEFANSIGSERGGNAKIVGSVIHSGEKDDGEGWDEVALAHYPSIWHFADMLASEDYQAVNQKYRVPSLKDTFILCTSEVECDGPTREAAKL